LSGCVDTNTLFIFFFPQTTLHSNPAAANVEMAMMSVASGAGPAADVPAKSLLHVLFTRANEQSHQMIVRELHVINFVVVSTIAMPQAWHELSNTSVTGVPVFTVAAMVNCRLSAAVTDHRLASASSDRDAQMTCKTTS
jgi:hypothetical protein